MTTAESPDFCPLLPKTAARRSLIWRSSGQDVARFSWWCGEAPTVATEASSLIAVTTESTSAARSEEAVTVKYLILPLTWRTKSLTEELLGGCRPPLLHSLLPVAGVVGAPAVPAAGVATAPALDESDLDGAAAVAPAVGAGVGAVVPALLLAVDILDTARLVPAEESTQICGVICRVLRLESGALSSFPPVIYVTSSSSYV